MCEKNVKFVSYALLALYIVSVDNDLVYGVFFRLALDNTSEIVVHVSRGD